MIRFIQLYQRKCGGKILFKRFCSTFDPNYVTRVRQMDYWQQSDHALESEFDRGHFILMVDKEPLIVKPTSLKNPALYTPELAICSYADLKTNLQDYGLEIGMLNSVLLDVLDPTEQYNDFRPLFGCAVRTMEPPAESGISLKNLRQKLGASLGGQFLNLRMAMLTLRSERHRNLLARVSCFLTRLPKLRGFLVSSTLSMAYDLQKMSNMCFCITGTCFENVCNLCKMYTSLLSYYFSSRNLFNY
jgi:hypothetical protein